MTEYRLIPYAPGYRVGDDGHVQTSKTKGRVWRDLKPFRNKKNYLSGAFSVDGERIEYRVHCLVLEMFVGPCPRGQQACHHPDPDPANCRLNNLRWSTPLQNSHDVDRQGRRIRGEAHYAAKLTEDDVRRIMVRTDEGETIMDLAKSYSVNHNTIVKIIDGQTWKHITARRRGWNQKRPLGWLLVCPLPRPNATTEG